MNNVIEQLKTQATEDIMGVPVLNAELFAKLIVKDCIETIGTFENTTTHEEQMSMLRNHFGVE